MEKHGIRIYESYDELLDHINNNGCVAGEMEEGGGGGGGA